MVEPITTQTSVHAAASKQRWPVGSYRKYDHTLLPREITDSLSALVIASLRGLPVPPIMLWT